MGIRRKAYLLKGVIFMNYCSIDMEWEPETMEEMDRVISHDEEILKVLRKGEHILPSEIARIVNYAMYDNGCFCEVKKKGSAWGHSRHSREWIKIGELPKRRREWLEKKRWSTVYFYTHDILVLQQLIHEVTGKFIELNVHGFDPYNRDNYRNNFFKVGISYDILLPFLISGMESLISGNYDFKEERMENQPG